MRVQKTYCLLLGFLFLLSCEKSVSEPFQDAQEKGSAFDDTSIYGFWKRNWATDQDSRFFDYSADDSAYLQLDESNQFIRSSSGEQSGLQYIYQRFGAFTYEDSVLTFYDIGSREIYADTVYETIYDSIQMGYQRRVSRAAPDSMQLLFHGWEGVSIEDYSRSSKVQP